jgi:adenylate kinase
MIMMRVSNKAAWVDDPQVPCVKHSPFPKRPFRLVLLGAPGVGKGTQADMLCQELLTCHLSTGEVFRAIKDSSMEKTPAQIEALAYVKRGELVPDDIVIDMVRERSDCFVCYYGFILDGFPRTVIQAEALNKMLDEAGVSLDAVINYDVPKQVIVDRLSGRRMCPNCRTNFHVLYKPPVQPGICDRCGAKLVQREDDRPESVVVRLEEYRESTAPLTQYYRDRGQLVEISAEGDPQTVFRRTMEMLEQLPHPVSFRS